jgi:hypothetical protein
MKSNSLLLLGNFTMLVFIFLLPAIVNAQPASRDTFDSTRVLAIDFLIANGELATTQREPLIKFLPMYELLSGTSVEANSVGVYSFKSINAPSKSFLMLKDKNTISILDPKELENCLIKVMAFLRERKYSDSTILSYIEATLQIYKGNRYKAKYKM